MNFFGKRVLFLGAHPDDIELGCGALLHNIKDKTDILCVTLSDNQKNPELQNVKKEHFESMAVLGVTEEEIVLGPFNTRVFPEARQEILEYFLKLRRDFNPDLIFVHSKADIHQDHNTMTEEALRAYRGITVLGFDVVRSSYGVPTPLVVRCLSQPLPSLAPSAQPSSLSHPMSAMSSRTSR